MRKKKFAPALFWLLVIPIITALILSLTSMTGPGGDWEIYEDDRWDFSLEYPAEWDYKIPVENYNLPDHVIKRMISFTGPGGATICLNVFSAGEVLSLMSWFDEIYRHLMSEEAVLPGLPNTTVNNYPALTVDNPQHMSCDLKHTFVKINSMVFEFQYRGSDHFESMEIYDHMLESFLYEGGNN